MKRKLSRIRKMRGNHPANFAGVCEGLGAFLRIHPWIIRGIFLVSAIKLPWFSILVYAGLALMLPAEEKKVEKPFIDLRRDRSKPLEFVVCPNCKTAVPASEVFCTACGKKLVRT